MSWTGPPSGATPRRRMRGRLIPLLLAASLAACGRRAPTASPEGAVRELVERMRRMHGDPAEAKAAYEMLSRRAQQNLIARAERYGRASGKAITPEAMIAPSRFVLRFEPRGLRRFAKAEIAVDLA